MSLSTAEFTYIADLVRKESAIVLEPGKEYLAESRLAPLVREVGATDISDLVGRLRAPTGATLRARVIEAMTTNETSWFRDIHPFDAMRTTVIPDLIERRRSRRALTVWCAASSSGQEPYSVAMMLRDSFPELASWQLRILCTDISPEMVRRTKEGRYSQLEVNRGLPAPMLVKWFHREGASWAVDASLRQLIDARPLNLAAPWPALPPADVVLLRNVLIYFDLDTKRSILDRVQRVLQPDGYLLLGGAETGLGIDDGLQRTPIGRTSWYRPAGLAA